MPRTARCSFWRIRQSGAARWITTCTGTTTNQAAARRGPAPAPTARATAPETGVTVTVASGASFVVNGAAQASDSALVTASAEMKWMNGWSAGATFEGEFSDVTESYAGKGVVRYAW
jgi:hypothetical protein